MATALGMEYADFLAEMATVAGVKVTDTSTIADLQRIMDSGLSQFYTAHSWTFLAPETTLALVAGTDTYDMPTAFSVLMGGIHFPADTMYPMVQQRPMAWLLELQAADSIVDEPRYVAIQPKSSDQAAQQLQEAVFWPEPATTRTMRYRYRAIQNQVRTANPYPLGGPEFSEGILLSMLDVWERRRDDAQGAHHQAWLDVLPGLIRLDNDRRPRNLGFEGTGPRWEYPPQATPRRTSAFTYEVT